MFLIFNQAFFCYNLKNFMCFHTCPKGRGFSHINDKSVEINKLKEVKVIIPKNRMFRKMPNKFENIGVSAGIVSFILQFSNQDSQIYQKALRIADKLMEKLRSPENLGEMGVGGYIALIDVLHKLNITDRFDLAFLSEKVKQLVNDAIERDASKWGLYGKRPADFIRSPESEFYEGNEEILQRELDYTVDTRVEKGVWGITWSWFDNNEKYPKEFAMSENWWKAAVAIEKVRLLKNFGRIE